MRHVIGLGVEGILQFGNQQRTSAHVEVGAIFIMSVLVGGICTVAAVLDTKGVVAIARWVVIRCGKHEGELV
ncbi:hypothetical protein NBRC3280_3425 [Acetobacter pasteurianus NBRC 3280]|nr:hypothetical protein NBRC3280_3425 [Acetobacter pasteurianus NBRC 3280]